MVVISVRGVKPPTQGSISAFGAGIAVDTHEKRLKPYRQKIRDAYKEQGGEYFDQYVPVCLEATFYFKKPKKPKAFLPSHKGADLDKLLRACGDGLTGVAWYDDCQVVEIIGRKAFCGTEAEEGVDLEVRRVRQ